MLAQSAFWRTYFFRRCIEVSGIAAIAARGNEKQAVEMLSCMTHRGKEQKTKAAGGTHMAVTITVGDRSVSPPSLSESAVWDGSHPPLPVPEIAARATEPFAMVAQGPRGFFAARDRLGIKPLYYGHNSEGDILFASEAKAMARHAAAVFEFPPGHWMDASMALHAFPEQEADTSADDDPKAIARELRLRIEATIVDNISLGRVGAWLSGGLDSSIITTMVAKHVSGLHTFAGGTEGSPDIEHARQMANFLGTKHHEIIIDKERVLSALESAIEALESFDALLVRSSVLNYLVGVEAGALVDVSFSGEGGDELFGGYDYLKSLSEDELPAELLDITGRLHNTALQRVDRCAAAGSLSVHVPFLGGDVVRFAKAIPARYKIKRSGDAAIEKWILRASMEGSMPESVLWRPKEKFWQGSGVGAILSEHAESMVSDADFRRERILSNGLSLNSKEELFYYRIFTERVGRFKNLDWMGRTKGAPVSA